ncbi:MAG: hypothetical protein Tsb009_37690 [Planctomycetaceae bacterium]
MLALPMLKCMAESRGIGLGPGIHIMDFSKALPVKLPKAKRTLLNISKKDALC